MSKGWNKSDWRSKPRVQMPDYPDADALNAAETQLAKYPPLVFAGEARRLKKQLALASEGKAFLLMTKGLEGARAPPRLDTGSHAIPCPS